MARARPNAIVTDAAGGEWIVYYAIEPAERFQLAIGAVRRPMLIDRLVLADGWPDMADEAPTTSSQHGPTKESDPLIAARCGSSVLL